MTAGSDRRTSPRVPCDASVTLDTFGVIAPGVARTGVPGRCADRSANDLGIGFETQQPLFTGQAVCLSEAGGRRSSVVRWVRAIPAGFRAGACFVR